VRSTVDLDVGPTLQVAGRSARIDFTTCDKGDRAGG
jgi:hypothetical protein